MRVGGLLLLAALLPGAGHAAELEVTITAIRSGAGHILVAVCDQSQFLQPSCAYRGRAPAMPGAVTVHIGGIPPGTYAAQAYGDENDNGRIDRNLLGIPTEGLGFSRDARISWGPPSFADAAFTLGEAGGRISFALHYYN